MSKFSNFRANLVEFRVEKGPFLFVPHWNNRTLYDYRWNGVFRLQMRFSTKSLFSIEDKIYHDHSKSRK